MVQKVFFKPTSTVAKCDGLVDQDTLRLYLRDKSSQLEVEDLAEMITFREDSGSKDNEIVATSARENCCNQKIDNLTEMAVVGSLGRIPKILLMEILLVQVWHSLW